MKFCQGLVLVDPHQNQRFIIVHFEANPCLAVLDSLRYLEVVLEYFLVNRRVAKGDVKILLMLAEEL